MDTSAFATARIIDRDTIPVIDIASLAFGERAAVAAQMMDAAQRVGFFYIRNHGVPQRLIDTVFEQGRRFFAMPRNAKDQVSVNAGHRGFVCPGEARMYQGAPPDLKESFVWGLERPDAGSLPDLHGIPANRWPAELPEMRSALSAYFDAANEVGWRLLRAFAAGLDIPPESFVRTIAQPTTRGTLVWYPPQPAELAPENGTGQFGVSPHTDWGCLTLLCQDGTGGLEVQASDGSWVTAHPIEGTYVVNVGDLLARWTNDRFRSTPHRVVNRSGRERLSLAAFIDPDRDTPIVPVVAAGETAHYPTVTCGDYVQQRFDAAFAYRQKPVDPSK